MATTSTSERKPRTKKTVEPVIDENTMGKVKEMTSGVTGNTTRTIEYSAPIKEKEEDENTEADDTGEDINYQDLFSNSQDEIREVPKTALAQLFELIAEASEYEGQVFYAVIERTPDFMGENFNTPCSGRMPFPPFPITALDMFKFIPALQKHNGNSGGRFNINICHPNGEPATVHRIKNFAHSNHPIGIASFLIPNPIKEAEQSNSNNNGFTDILNAMREDQRQFKQDMLNLVNKPKEPSLFEKALEQKMIHEITNPQTGNKGFDINEFTAQIMQQGAVMNGLGQAFNQMIFREPSEPPEPDLMDKINKITSNPAIGSLIGRIGDIAEAVAVSKLPDASEPKEQVNETTDDMQTLLVEVITEIDGDNAINLENEFIQGLIQDYPEQVKELQEYCQCLPFEGVFNLLNTKARKIQPYPFTPYLDVEASQVQSKLIWNEKGTRMLSRLTEVYELVKTLPL